MKFATVEQAVAWLDAQANPMRRVGLEKIRVAMEYVGNPHKGLPVIHITGTNGKGSTTTFLKELLQSQGLAVGTFTSPHIMRFNERFSYNSANISDEDLIALVEQMVDVNEYMDTTPYGKLVFFELYTIMVALYFQAKQPDVCLIEVGIGGANDCTNIFDASLVILTTIGLDHEDILGNTLEAVATEKAGLIKDKAIVVTGPIAPSPLQVIKDRVERHQGIHFAFDQDYGYCHTQNLYEKGSSFEFWLESMSVRHTQMFSITMLGHYQIDNATIALRAFFAWMQMVGEAVAFDAAYLALKDTKWMARMERISDEPVIYIDGAHNAHGLNALKSLVDTYFPDKQITILYAGLSTKNQDEQLPILDTFNAEAICLTQFDHNRAMTVDDFYEMAEANKRHGKLAFDYALDWESFIADYLVRNVGQANAILLVTGSLYFVSVVRQLIKDKVQV